MQMQAPGCNTLHPHKHLEGEHALAGEPQTPKAAPNILQHRTCRLRTSVESVFQFSQRVQLRLVSPSCSADLRWHCSAGQATSNKRPKR